MTETAEGAHCDSGSVFLLFFQRHEPHIEGQCAGKRRALDCCARNRCHTASAPLPAGLFPLRAHRPSGGVPTRHAACFSLSLSPPFLPQETLFAVACPHQSSQFFFSPLWLENFCAALGECSALFSPSDVDILSILNFFCHPLTINQHFSLLNIFFFSSCLLSLPVVVYRTATELPPAATSSHYQCTFLLLLLCVVYHTDLSLLLSCFSFFSRWVFA